MKKRVVLGLCLTAMLLLFLLPQKAQAAGKAWVKSEWGGWYLYDQTSAEWKDSMAGDPAWTYIGTTYYHCLGGWQKVGTSWYYLHPDEYYMYENGQYEINGRWYFFAKNGVMQTGWIKEVYDDGSGANWYYAGGNGALLSGWQKISGKWYYFDTVNYIMNNYGVCDFDGKAYYFAKSGAMQTGWIKEVQRYDDGTTQTFWYYANSSGVLLDGWQSIGGKWYYFEPEAYNMYHGESYEINHKVYIFEDSGALGSTAGWLQNREGWFYIHSDGTPYTGWKKISGKSYYFNEDWGFMTTMARAIGTTLYDFASDGSYKTVTTNGWQHLDERWFYVESRKAVTGWKKIGSHWYYFYPENGIMATDSVQINGKVYAFETSGALHEKAGWFRYDYEDYVYWYLTNADGTCRTGWQKVGSNWYYFDPEWGSMQTGWIWIEDKDYFFDDNGVWVKNPE